MLYLKIVKVELWGTLYLSSELKLGGDKCPLQGKLNPKVKGGDSIDPGDLPMK